MQKEIKRQQLATEVQYLLVDDKRRGEAKGKQIELQKLADETARLGRDLSLAEHGIVAPFDGVVTALDYRLQKGFEPGEGVVVGEFESPAECVVHALVPAKDLTKLHLGQKVELWFQMGTGMAVTGYIEEIKPYGEQDLKNLSFSSRFGGELATEARGEDLKDAPLDALYRCSINLENGHRIPLGMTGRLVLDSPPRSLLAGIVENVFQTLNKESVFW